MIRIQVGHENGFLTDLRISGHAGSDSCGKDLVCAGVSSVAFGLLNALDELAGVKDLQVGDNLIAIHIDDPTDQTDWIMKTGLIQLRTIEESSRDFVEIIDGGVKR